MHEDEKRRRIFLAVDGTRGRNDTLDLIEAVVQGPIGRYIKGLKFNNVLQTSFSRTIIEWVQNGWPELAFFADLKLADISATNLNTVGRWCDGMHNIIVTVSLHSSPKTFAGLAKEYPNVWVAAMGVPTDWKTEECIARYGMTPGEAMFAWLQCLREQYLEIRADEPLPTEPCRFAIASADMLTMMAENFPAIGCITPGIRDEWMTKGGQERTVGIAQALRDGARFVVLGSQLTKGNPDRGITTEASQLLTANEIEKALSARQTT